MSRRVQVTFDAGDPHRLAVWWCDLLGYEIESANELVSRLLQSRVVGEPDVVRIDGRLFFADAVAAVDPEGTGPRFLFQRVPEQKVAIPFQIGLERNPQLPHVPAVGASCVSTCSIVAASISPRR